MANRFLCFLFIFWKEKSGVSFSFKRRERYLTLLKQIYPFGSLCETKLGINVAWTIIKRFSR